MVVDVQARKRVSTSHPLPHPSSAAFRPDGALLAIKGTSGRIAIVNPESGAVITTHKQMGEGEGSSVRFSPCGRYLVDGSWGGLLTVRDALSGNVAFQEHFPEEMITEVSHDAGRRAWLIEHTRKMSQAGWKRDKSAYLDIRRWPFETGTRSARLQVHPIAHATMSPDGRQIAAISDQKLLVLRTSDGSTLCSTANLLGGTGCRIGWSADGSFIGAVKAEAFRIYRSENLALIREVPTDYPSDIAFSSDSMHVSLGTWTRGILTRTSNLVGDYKPPTRVGSPHVRSIKLSS